eukprot:352009_1
MYQQQYHANNRQIINCNINTKTGHVNAVWKPSSCFNNIMNSSPTNCIPHISSQTHINLPTTPTRNITYQLSKQLKSVTPSNTHIKSNKRKHKRIHKYRNKTVAEQWHCKCCEKGSNNTKSVCIVCNSQQIIKADQAIILFYEYWNSVKENCETNKLFSLGKKIHYMLDHFVESMDCWNLPLGYKNEQSIEHANKKYAKILERYCTQRGTKKLELFIDEIMLITCPLYE